MKGNQAKLKEFFQRNLNETNKKTSESLTSLYSSMNTSTYVNKFPLEPLKTVEELANPEQSLSKMSKKLKKLLPPPHSPHETIEKTNKITKTSLIPLKNPTKVASLSVSTQQNLNKTSINSLKPSDFLQKSGKTLSFLDSDDSSSKESHPEQRLSSLKSYMKPTKSSKLMRIQDFSHENPAKASILSQPVMEEPENLLRIQQHPRIRKSSFSKADKLMQDWLETRGKLNEEQEKILGNSGRMQKKAVFFYINKLEERNLPLNLFIDQRILNKRKFALAKEIIEFYRQNCNEILPHLHELLTLSQKFATSPQTFRICTDFIRNFLAIAGSSFKHEVSVYFYKYFAKLLTFYQDFTNARGLIKAGFSLAKQQNLYEFLMTLYKRMGRVNRKLNKHRVSLKYFLRMLNMSWFLDNETYEFLAYDEIGLCFYYLNELERANFYHSRMLEGEKEPKTSISRQLGLLKTKNFLANYSRVNEDLLGNLSKDSSENEEELLFGEKKVYGFSKKDKKSQIEMKIFLKKNSEKLQDFAKKVSIDKKTASNRAALPKLKENLPIIRNFRVGDREILLAEKTMVFERKKPFISHLSRNRRLVNYYEFHYKLEEEDEEENHREIIKINQFDMAQNLDEKTQEKIRHMAKKLKNNLEVAILYLETYKNRLGQEQRRPALFLRPVH